MARRLSMPWRARQDPRERGLASRTRQEEPWGRRRKKMAECAPRVRPPPSPLPPPFTHPRPLLPRKLHSCRPGPTSLAAWTRWVVRSTRPAKGRGCPHTVINWLFGGGPGRLCFLHFSKNQSIVLGVGGSINTPPFKNARAHAQTGWPGWSRCCGRGWRATENRQYALAPLTTTNTYTLLSPPLSLFSRPPKRDSPFPRPPLSCKRRSAMPRMH